MPPPTLSIAISPTTASIVPNGKLTFSVGVSNATNPAVTLTVNNIPGGNATVGTITSGASVSGTTPTALYQAPAAPPVPNTVMVTATSVQDPTKSATALVVITNTPPAVTVNVTPSAVSVAPGAATPFTTAVTGTANTSVSWAVNGIAGGNNIVGLISPQGVYTAPLAPPSPPSVTVTATSLADPTASGSASVTVQVVVNVTVSPTVANVVTGTPLTFTAVVTGSPNTNVQWSVAGVIGGNATVGTIGITTGVYNAPAAVPAQATVTVTATSVADPTKSDSAQLTITAPNQVGVSVAPATTMVAINGIQQFIATVTGTANTLVTWSVNGTPGGTVAAGTITATGLYTAPGAVPIPNTVTVSATSVVANISGTATVQVTGAGAVNVSVAPAVTSIQTSSTQQFAATVTGTTTTTVTWSVNGMNGGNAAIGTISGAGLYTAPASVPTPATVTITATSTASPSSSGSAALTIILLPAPVVVTVAPTSGSLKVTSQFLFTATVSGAPVGQTGVNWSVNGVAGGNASVGTISSAGLYTAPSAVPSPATVQVKATSQFQSNSSATSNITILPQDTITMTPTAANVQVGLGAQFFVTITGLSNTAVTFKVNGVVGGNSTVGTVSASGLYLAPAVVPTPATVSLTATSVADLTLIATSTITISPLVVVTVAPTTKTLALSGVQTFTATVTGTANTAVNWSVNGVAPPGNATVGLITNTGQYTAPASLLLTSTFTVTATSVVNPAALANALVTVNVPVGVTVAPSTPTVAVNGTIAFSATVTGATNTAVTWSVSGPANPGTINSASGVYTAPAAPPAGAVTITATSQANPAATGSTTVTVQLPVSVNLTPNPVNVDTGTTQAFTATVMNAVNTAVTWTVNGAPNGNASVGTINPSTGVYTAPNAIPTPATVTVTATSVADPTKSASSSVTVTPLVTAVSVSPLTPSIATNGTQQFSATVTGTGNLGVTWQVNGTTGGNINTVGSISASGLYTAPSFTVVTTATMFTITAVSVQNPGVSGSTTITVTPPPITVTVSPDPVTVTVNATQQFTVVVTNAQNPAVTWSVVGVAANGTINSVTGLYTAPPAPPAGAVTVLAVSNQNNTKSDTATVTVVSGIAVTVSPAKTNVIVGTTQQFTATVTGTANQTVTWSVVGGAANGSINVNSGLYTAPATVPAPASVTVVATSAVAPNPNGSTTLTVVPAVVVTVAPTPISLNAGGPAQVFTATVTGTSNTAVTWFVNGVMGGNATVGTIVQATGLYTPPAAVPNPAVVTVTAVSQADPTKSGAASVTIQGVITVSVSPATVGVNINTTQQFSATVTNASNPAVNWTISGTGNIGSIGLTTGLYTAPSSVPTPATVTVTATSVQNGTSQGTATITVQPVVSVSISPNAASLNPNQQSQFTATVTGSANTAVTWTVNGIAGGNSTVGLISASGLYTAPAIVPSSPVVSVTATSAADPTKSASAAVTISAPGAGIFVTVFPRNKRLKMGQKSQFDSHVFLTPNTAVNWSIGGPSCAGAGNPCGTIDPVTMIFTTPAALPANPNITVTATSQADPTKSDTQNERLILGVEVMPESADPHITETVQFSAFVRASSNQSLNWFVNGIPNGNATVGTISNSGLYTAPGSVPNPGFVTVSAISVADPTLPGVATIKVYGAKVMKLFPTTVSVLPGWRVNFQHFTNVVFPVTAPSFGLLVNWSVNGVVGGNSTVGTITNYGQYAAPASPQTVTVAVQSTINPSFTAQATVTITSGAGASAATLLDTFTKVRPYDIISGTASLNVAAAHQEYADWQVLVTANGEDLTGVDVNVSNFTDGLGNVIPSSNATIYFERPLNVFYPSRFQYSDVGEWPDPMVPKVDPFVHETRNAFPFGVNRISPAYKRYPVVNVSDTTNVGMGAGKATSGGVYTGTVQQRLDMVIDAAGAVGTATFKWSTNGGTTFQQTGVKTSTSPVTLANGVTVSFQAGGVSGVADFNVGDTFWIFAGPLRNQPVWFDLYIPMPTPAGNYTGTVTVTESGKAPQILTVNLQVYTFAIPVSSSFPSRWGAYWQGYEQAHYFVPYDPNLQAQLGKLYGTACLINRMSCETNTVPNITYSANGMVATADYTGSDQTLAPLANGTITPHGEQLTAINQNLLGGTDTQMYFSTQNQLAHAVAKGWRSRLYDYTYDEPSGPAFPQLTARASLVRSVDITFRTLVTTDISDNLIGFVSRYVPNWVNIGLKEYQRGPTSASRSFYNDPIANGDDLWWYDSCTTQGCGSIGFVPYNDNYPNSMADTSALMNRCWGIMGLIPYQVTGVLYFDSSYSFDLFLGMNPPRVDTWDSIFYFSGNGDGSLFYPGRPSVIGGTTHIPVESFRMKQIRDAFVDMEYGLKLQNQGDGAFLATNVLQVVQDIYTYEANPATWAALRKTLGQKIK